MAKFEKEMNWGKYQQEQMKVLTDISKAFDQSLKLSQQVGTHLGTSMSKVEYAITSIAHATESSAMNISLIARDLVKDAVVYKKEMDDATLASKKFTLQMEDSTKKEKKTSEQREKSGREFNDSLKEFSKYLAIAGKEADNFSKISNTMIQVSGMSGDVVREFKSELMSIVNDMNKQTGYAFNSQESYKSIAAMSQSVTSNLEAIEEMARPILLAEESMIVDTKNIATLFNKFYTRYQFSSMEMEDTLDGIRSNTAGNSATAEATLKNINALENWINNYAGNDNKLRQELLERVSNYTSWIESMNMDSSAFTNYLNIAAYGDWSSNSELLHILSKSGIDAGTATEMAQSGQYEALTTGIMDGIYDIMMQFDKDRDGSIEDVYALGAILDNYHIDRNLAMEVWNAKNSTGYSSFEEFIEEQSKNKKNSMEDIVEDKYYSAQEKANNWLQQIYSKMASIQEYLPFGFSDIANLLAIIASGKLLGKLFGGTGGGGSPGGKVGNFFGTLSKTRTGANQYGTWTKTTPGTGALGFLEKVGTNATGAAGGKAALAGGVTLAGIGGGVALTVDGLQDAFDEGKDTGTRVFGGVEAAAGATGATLLGLAAAGLATGPAGWIALAVGGAAAIAKNVYEDATALSGNGKAVAQAFEGIKKSLKEENTQRIKNIADIKLQFEEAATLEAKKNVLVSSGLISMEELEGKNETALSKLIDSYLNAAIEIDRVTNNYLKKDEKRMEKILSDEQKDFMEELYDNYEWVAEEQGEEAAQDLYYSIVNMLESYVEDEELLKQIDKILDDGTVTKKEAKKLFEGNNAGFVKNVVPAEAMRILSTVYGNEAGMESLPGPEDITVWKPEDSEKSARLLAGLTQEFELFIDHVGSEDSDFYLKRLQDYINDTLLAPENEKYYDYLDWYDDLYPYQVMRDHYVEEEGYDIPYFAEGTNLLPHDTLAYLHEGEAVVPKKYNPAANNIELSRAIDYLKGESQSSSNDINEYKEYLASFVSEVKEIRELLSEWKSSNSSKDRMNRINSMHPLIDYVTNHQAQYM